MACGSCHTTGSFEGDPQQDMHLAGDLIINADYGRLAAPNITPDKESGIGAWTDGEIIRAITKGLGRDNRLLLPIMPWATFGAVLTDEEAMALVATGAAGDTLVSPFSRDFTAGVMTGADVGASAEAIAAR